jgi:molecular chaperone GrpE
MHEEKERQELDAETASSNGEAAEPADTRDVGHREPEFDDDAPGQGAEGDDSLPDDDEAAADEGGLKDQLLRALADIENVRRRAKKDVNDARAYAISSFAQDLLSVADNLSRALESIPAEAREEHETVKAIAEGVDMTARELDTVLSRHGITKIHPLGEKFDYNLHQALFETDQTDQPDGTVVQVAQVGYSIGDRLLRAAMVGVAKGGTAAPGDGSAEAEAEDSGSGVGKRVDTSA